MLAAVAVVLLAAVAFRDTTRPVLREVSVQVPGLSREVTLLHVSDLHGRTFGPDQRRLEALLGDRHFDAAVLTGDFQGDGASVSAPTRRLIEIASRHSNGVYLVHGNHEALDTEAVAKEMGVVDLSVRAEPATIAADAGRVALIGSFWLSRRPQLDEDALIAISHVPPTADDVRDTSNATRGVRLFLAGHTHGGQMRIPFVGAVWAPTAYSPFYENGSEGAARNEWFPEWHGRTIRGLFRMGDAWVNVSAGLGTMFVPVRLFDQAEMTVVHLVPEAAAVP